MEIKPEKKLKKGWGNVYKNAVQLILVGFVTGIFAGAIVTLYNILVKYGESISQDAYGFIRANPAWIPLLFLVLGLGSFLLSVAVYLFPMIKGSGIPQTEGATRGLLRFKWYRDAVAMFAASLLSIFMGLSAGGEGPSLHIGAACGDGVASLFKRNEMIRRYQVTGGACAGLAVAFSAPLTGVAFAFEEAHKRFTPEVFICSFSSVISALLTRNFLYYAFHLEMKSFFHAFAFPQGMVTDWKFYCFLVAGAIICALVGILFQKWVMLLYKLFGKISFKKKFFSVLTKISIAVLLGGILSLITVNVMGGGHGLIEALGTNGGTSATTVTSIFSLPLLATLLIVCVLKFSVTGVNMGAGIPCGAFIPMLSIGACLGAVLNLAWVKLGLDPVYCDFLVMICMAAFFTAIVRAPLTAIVMVCELTWNFSALLPVIIGVAIGYFIGDLSRTDGIYETLLEKFEEETGGALTMAREIVTFTVGEGSLADKREIRDVLWPHGVKVQEIVRGGVTLLPDGETVLCSGDILTIVCQSREPQKTKDDLKHILD